MPSPIPQRIDSLESLRGLLALWVVAGHSLRYCGITYAGPGPLGLLLQPGLAVDVFIILSGFVISHLLARGTDYSRFIVRRFFRLAPLYFAVLAASAATIHQQYALMSSLPWQTPAVVIGARIMRDTIATYPEQLLAHLTMLHGAIPLPSGDYTFLTPAWSISVEWQFYLVAPAVIGLALSRRWAALAAVVVAICAVRAANYLDQGFAPNKAPYFAIGILSYFTWSRLRMDAGQRYFVAAICVALPYLLLQRWAPLAVWGIVFAAILPAAEGDVSLAIIRRLFGHRVLRWLGDISYSIYLTHILILIVVMGALRAAAPAASGWGFALPATLATLTCTVAVSWVTRSLIEVPGIAIGRRLTARKKQTDIAPAKI